MALPAGYSAFATVSLVSSVGYIGSVTWTSILLIWTIQTTSGTISVSSTWKERYSHLIEHHISQSLPLWLNKHPKLCKKHLGNCKKVGKTWNGLTKRNNSTKFLLLHHPLLLKEFFYIVKGGNMKQVLSIIKNKSLKTPFKKKDSFKTPQALCQHLISITINVMTFKTMNNEIQKINWHG